MDINLLSARINDLNQLCEKTNSPKFIGFLTADEVAVAIQILKNGQKYRLFGGYAEAERVFLSILPDWCNQPQFPITAITFTYRKCDVLTHRDFLGAFMSLGITRETIGDILIEQGRAVAFVSNDVFKFVFSQLDKIGKIGVVIKEGYVAPLPQISKKQSFVSTIASMRLDCVVASLCNISRSQAVEKIQEGVVSVNSVAVTKVTTDIKSHDKITVRRYGKFEIVDCNDFSKKGRIILKYNKYV